MTVREGVGSRERERGERVRERGEGWGEREQERKEVREIVGERKCDGATHIIKTCFAQINL